MNGDPNQYNQQMTQNQLVQQLLAQQQQVQMQNRAQAQGAQFNSLVATSQGVPHHQIQQQQQAQNQQRQQLYTLMNQQSSNLGGQLQQTNAAGQAIQIRHQGQTGLQFASLQGANANQTQGASALEGQIATQGGAQNQMGQNYNEELLKQLSNQKAMGVSQLGAQRQGQLIQGSNLTQMLLQNNANQGIHSFQQASSGIMGMNSNTQTQQQQLQGQFRTAQGGQQHVENRFGGLFTQPQDASKLQNQQNPLLRQIGGAQSQQQQQNQLRNIIGSSSGIQGQLQGSTSQASGAASLAQNQQTASQYPTQSMNQNQIQQLIQSQKNELLIQKGTPQQPATGTASVNPGVQVQIMGLNAPNQTQLGHGSGASNIMQTQQSLLQTQNQNQTGQQQKSIQDILAAQALEQKNKQKQTQGFNNQSVAGQINNFSGSQQKEGDATRAQMGSNPGQTSAQQQQSIQQQIQNQTQGNLAQSNPNAIAGQESNFQGAHGVGLSKAAAGQANIQSLNNQNLPNNNSNEQLLQYQMMQQKQQKTADGQNPGQPGGQQQIGGAGKPEINSNIHQMQFMQKLNNAQPQNGNQPVVQQAQSRIGGGPNLNQIDQIKQQFMTNQGMQQKQQVQQQPPQAQKIPGAQTSDPQSQAKAGAQENNYNLIGNLIGQLNQGGPAAQIPNAGSVLPQNQQQQPVGGPGANPALLMQKLSRLSSEQQNQPGRKIDSQPSQQQTIDVGESGMALQPPVNQLNVGGELVGQLAQPGGIPKPEGSAAQDPSGATGGMPQNRTGQPQNSGVASQLANMDTGGDGDNLVYVDRINKLAEYCATNGEYQVAIEYYVKLITIDSENGPAWTALGHCYLLVEDLQNSFNAYQRALYSLEDIKDPQLWYGIGILYEKFESYDHAISALIAVLKMSPNFYQKSEVLYKLGMIFAKTNQIQQAISYFQNSILTNTFTLKRKTDTLIKIGMLYEELKDFNQAMREYEAATIGDKSNYKIYLHMAWCSFQMGKINKALEYINSVEQLHPFQADTLYIQGRCHMALNNNKKALELLQEAAFKYPGEAAYWATLAIVYYQNGDYSDSFENIIKATSLNTFKPEIWYNLGILYEKCKQPEEALIAYSKVKDLCPGDEDSLMRINAIQSPQYNSQNGQNQSIFNLQMKQPIFTLPNSLTILKKYKKQSKDGENGTSNAAGAELPVQGQSLVTPAMGLVVSSEQQEQINLQAPPKMEGPKMSQQPNQNNEGLFKMMQQPNQPGAGNPMNQLHQNQNQNNAAQQNQASNLIQNFQNQLNEQQQPSAQQQAQPQQQMNALTASQPRLNIPQSVAGNEAIIQNQIQQQQQQQINNLPQNLPNQNQLSAATQPQAQQHQITNMPSMQQNFSNMTGQNQSEKKDIVAQSQQQQQKESVEKPLMNQMSANNFPQNPQQAAQLAQKLPVQQTQPVEQAQNQFTQNQQLPPQMQPESQMQSQPNAGMQSQNKSNQQQWGMQQPQSQSHVQPQQQNEQQSAINQQQNAVSQMAELEAPSEQPSGLISKINNQDALEKSASNTGQQLDQQQQIHQPPQQEVQQVQNQYLQKEYANFQPQMQQNQMQANQQRQQMFQHNPQAARNGAQTIQQVPVDVTTSQQLQNNKTVSSHDPSVAVVPNLAPMEGGASNINEASQQQQQQVPPSAPITVNGMSLEQHSMQQIQEKLKQDQLKMSEFQNPQNQTQPKMDGQTQQQSENIHQSIQFDSQKLPNATVEGSQNISVQFDQQSHHQFGQKPQQFVNPQGQKSQAPLGFVQNNQFGIVDPSSDTNNQALNAASKPPAQMAQQSERVQNPEGSNFQKLNDQMSHSMTQNQMNSQIQMAQVRQQQHEQQVQAMVSYHQNFTQPQSVTNQQQMINQSEMQNQMNQHLQQQQVQQEHTHQQPVQNQMNFQQSHGNEEQQDK